MIVLAAGKSSRFGRNKLLEDLEGKTVIERVLKSCIDSQVDQTIVVLGFDNLRVKQQLSGHDCIFALNSNFEEGQSSSVKAGMSAISEQSEAVLITPGDVPLITPEQINEVIFNYRKSGFNILVASHKGGIGHPILFDRALFPEISQISEKKLGLREVTTRHRGEIRRVEVESEGVLRDIDTEEEFRNVKGILGKEGSE
ncbi:MAG: NTP transferase domain-containing protein [Nitrososphaerales archaeon]